MAPLNDITSQQLNNVLEELLQNKNSLRHHVDNAGQTAWFLAGADPKLAAMNEKIDSFIGGQPQAREMLMKYSSRIISETGRGNSSYPKAQLHGYLSLLYHVTPETRKAPRTAIEKTLEGLDIGKPLPEDDLRKALPDLLTSLQPTRGRG